MTLWVILFLSVILIREGIWLQKCSCYHLYR